MLQPFSSLENYVERKQVTEKLLVIVHGKKERSWLKKM
jgi:hypothetical protein